MCFLSSSLFTIFWILRWRPCTSHTCIGLTLLTRVQKDPLQNMSKEDLRLLDLPQGRINRISLLETQGKGGPDGHSSSPAIRPFRTLKMCLCVCSDSGDSLFITQKEIPSPVRSARRHRHGKRSAATSSRCLEESEVESSSSSSQEESTTHKKTTRKKNSLPIFTFSVLGDNKSDGLLPSQKNRILHVRRNTALTHPAYVV